jgi:hypothetical protein
VSAKLKLDKRAEFRDSEEVLELKEIRLQLKGIINKISKKYNMIDDVRFSYI